VSRSLLSLAAIALASIVAGRTVAAQTAAIAGTVLRDSTDKPLPETAVSISALNRTTRTNYLGEFRLDNLAAGTYVLVFRHVGFTPRTDTIVVKPGETRDGEFGLSTVPVELSAQKTVATATEPSTFIDKSTEREFNDRMKIGLGHFVTDSMLRKDADTRNFAYYLRAHFPGVRVVDLRFEQILASGRKSCPGSAFSCGSGAAVCPIEVYVDGMLKAPYDFQQVKSEDFAAVEFYTDGATMPARFNRTSHDCGVILLWTRTRAP
jgi:hypothetical protein